MSDPCVWAVSDEQVLGPNRYLEGEERAKAFKAPVMTAFSEAPIFYKEKITPTKYVVALQRRW
jgi:hypothetical protein